MRLLITGASGLLGSKLAELAVAQNHEVYSAYRRHKPIHGEPIRLDITDKNKVEKILGKIKPDAVIHTAGLTDVDRCEEEKDEAWRANAEAARGIAAAAKSIAAHLTFVSTDYVFGGQKGLYTEEDEPNPISYYGYTKLKGEEYTKQNAAKWCIARTSGLYGWSGHKKNFACWVIDRLKQEKTVRVLKGQYSSPTLNTDLAEMLLEISQKGITGILHTAGATRVSRHECALKLAEVFGLNVDLIEPATLEEMPWKAQRPRDSSLNVSKTTNMLRCKPLTLDRALERMKEEES